MHIMCVFNMKTKGKNKQMFIIHGVPSFHWTQIARGRRFNPPLCLLVIFYLLIAVLYLKVDKKVRKNNKWMNQYEFYGRFIFRRWHRGRSRQNKQFYSQRYRQEVPTRFEPKLWTKDFQLIGECPTLETPRLWFTWFRWQACMGKPYQRLDGDKVH